MPIIECDAWRQQYFKDIYCPDHITICTDDTCAIQHYPDYAWVYNKINLCKLQDISYGEFKTKPPRYPVFSKPITNLLGMGVDSHLLRNDDDYYKHCKDGMFWMQYFQGEHLSTDVILSQGRVVWCGHVKGISSGLGTFDYWHVETTIRMELESKIFALLNTQMSDYSGIVNIESIDGNIIELHLRLTDQWPDLYGKNWLDRVVSFYSNGAWTGPRRPERQAYSVVLFGPHGVHYQKPNDTIIEQIKNQHNISSIQITFDPNLMPEDHAMPPGGFRLAIINCFELEIGRGVCKKLADIFGIHYRHEELFTKTQHSRTAIS